MITVRKFVGFFLETAATLASRLNGVEIVPQRQYADSEIVHSRPESDEHSEIRTEVADYDCDYDYARKLPKTLIRLFFSLN